MDAKIILLKKYMEISFKLKHQPWGIMCQAVGLLVKGTKFVIQCLFTFY